MQRLLSMAMLLATGVSAFAQNFDPPSAKTPDAATLKKIEEQTAKLREVVAEAVKKVPQHEADLAIYVKAAEWIVRHQEWFTVDSGKQTLAVIEQGLKRAEAAKDGKTPWLDPKGESVARGYRSTIDGSVQPYGVIYPVGYGEDKKKKWRLDVFLHGRDSSLTEVKHLYQNAGKKTPKEQDYVQLNIYGRGNNAYRWAGEEDVHDVVAHFLETESAKGRELISDDQRVLKGFSMGGAGAWHIGLRSPDRFNVIQPGAGFTTTHGYVSGLPDPLPSHQEACLRIYDAVRYAENAFNVPIVAYSGEKDKQRQAAENIEVELKKLKLANRMTHLIGPGLEHKFPPEWQLQANEHIKKQLATNPASRPKRVRFVTYSLKDGACNWVWICGLEKHYERASVDASWDGKTFDVKTSNVARILLWAPSVDEIPETVTIDGQKIKVTMVLTKASLFGKIDGNWACIDPLLSSNSESKNLRFAGPIDDAFCSPFVCVVGSGTPMFPEVHAAAITQLDRFRREWDKYMRGTLEVKKDTEVTDKDKEKNLILFGDPGSNRLIAEVMKKMPFEWTKGSLQFDGKKYDAKSHLPMLIQPSPFSHKRYVVFNSGHTFHEADFKGTNALLYPRLGDFAVVKPTPTDMDPAAFEVITAGLFGEQWQFPKK